MPIQFTPQQQKVIDLHNRNILVSAAAGSGKTAVLVERIIRMVCDEAHPVDIDRLLIVTFTNAAAAEMRERISLGISRELELHPESEHIERQATLLHNALITTIDSFCLYIIRNHFHEIGLDPAFRVADEGEIRLLQQEVLSEFLEERFAARDPAFLHCVEFFCHSGRESVLERYILELYTHAESFPWPEEWLEERKNDYVLEEGQCLEDTAYGSFLAKHLGRMASGCVTVMRRVQKLCQEADGPYMYGSLVDQELEQLERAAESQSLAEYEERLGGVQFGRLPAKKDDTVSAEKKELAKALRSQVKDTVKEINARFFAVPVALARQRMEKCAEPVRVLAELSLDFLHRLDEKKREKKILDFSDMEHLALSILIRKEGGELTPSRVALEYRQYFHEILIDEYQDSNLVQEYLLKAVSGEEDGRYNRFMVGDVKQSIYRFRLARPELFLEKYVSYKAQDGDRQRIDLSRNFRSRETVVNTVNGIFSRIMSEEIGGIEYDDRAALYAGAQYPENPGCESELLLVEKPEEGGMQSAKQQESRAIAHRIKALRESGLVTDKETGLLRPVQFRDIVILLRSTSGWDETFKEVLEEEGIPVYITSRTGYFASSEIQRILQLLRVLDNPGQDLALYSVMTSVFGGFTQEEVAVLRSADHKCLLWECVRACGQGEDTPLAGKCKDFLERIETYRSYTVYMPVRELLQTILSEYHYLDYVSALPGGGRRRANVEMLLIKASDFEKTSYFGLFHFVRYIEQLEKYEVDYGEAELMDENADVVRIMSIHKSKGLEFPVTFVAGLSKRFNLQEVNRALLIDMDMGLGVDYVDVDRRVRSKTLRRVALSRKLKEENLSEELRVLYVALTRAKEKLILTATAEHAQEVWDSAGRNRADRLDYLQFINAGSFLELLLPVIDEKDIQVRVLTSISLLGDTITEQMHLSERRLRLREAGSFADPDRLEMLRKRFAYRYAHENLAKLYTKTTVSELKLAAMQEKDEAAYELFEEKEPVPYIPSFVSGKEEAGATTRGNAFHKCMELLDWEQVYGDLFDGFPESEEIFAEGIRRGKKDVLQRRLEAFLEEETSRGRLTEEYRSAVNPRKLLRFLTDPLAYRMWRAQRAGKLYREQPFVYGISAGRLGEDFPAEEKVLIQGIIDAFFVENEGIILVDYKTDRVDTPEELWNRYAAQLDYYKEALEKLMRLPVRERILYSFRLEKCVTAPLPSDDLN